MSHIKLSQGRTQTRDRGFVRVLVVIVVVLIALALGFLRGQRNDRAMDDFVDAMQRQQTRLMEIVQSDTYDADSIKAETEIMRAMIQAFDDTADEMDEVYGDIFRIVADELRRMIPAVEAYDEARLVFLNDPFFTGTGIIDVDDLNQSLEVVRDLREANAGLQAAVARYITELSNRIQALDMPSSKRAAVLRGLQQSAQTEHTERIRELDDDICQEWERMLEILIASKGRWEVDATTGEFIFDDILTGNEYQQHFDRMVALGEEQYQEQLKLMEESQRVLERMQ